MHAILAIEPKVRIADRILLKAASLGISVEVCSSVEDAVGRVDEGVRYIAGFFNRDAFPGPREEGADGPVLVPFLRGDGSDDDHDMRWELFLEGVEGRLSAAGDGLDALGRWVDARFEEKMEVRHRELIESLNPVFLDLERRDPTVRDHSFRVGIYAARIGATLGLSPVEVRLLQLGGWVHDVGKTRIKTKVLRKGGILTPDEKRSIRFHPVWGSEMVEEKPVEREIYWMVRHHHERFDGHGYPEFIGGEEIPILARVLAVADTYDAMTSNRPYRTARDHRTAVREILNCSGTQFDPSVVQAFLTARLDRVSF